MTNTYKPEGMIYNTAENREFISGGIAGLERAMAEGRILEAQATMCDSDMCLHLDLYGIPAVIEKEETLFSPCGEAAKDIAIITRVGKPTCFKVLGFFEKDGKRTARLSRREAQKECFNEYVASLVSGDIIEAKVTRLENFGAFADVGCGLVSLLSIDCISVSRISHPSDRLSVGNVIWAAVKSIEYDTGRVFLSQRELLGTWEENAFEFAVGQTVAGIIRSVESYGVFIELAPNLAGLAELRSEEERAALTDLIGQSCAVYIKSIIPERMKVKLVLVDTYKGDKRKAPPKYFTDGNSCKHLDHWRYSPTKAQKTVETIF